MQSTDFYIPKQKYFYENIQQIKGLQGKEQDYINLGKSIVLSGFPYDEGTKRNGGRVGGAVAPSIFRKNLKEQLYLHHPVVVWDSGDVKAEMQLQDAHIQLYQKHKKIFSNNSEAVIFSIGGSNDQSYPNVRALLEAYPQKRVGVINLDAHFDVRPLKQGKAHSGSPFRQMLQNQIFQKNQSIFIQFANKGATCSNQHRKYLSEKGAQVYWLQKDIRMFQIQKQNRYKTQAGQLFNKIIEELKTKVEFIFVSFDSDSINSKFMPGVSAPSVVGGLTSTEALQIMQISGLEQKVKLVDCSQFNPAVQSVISSKMLVQMFYTFIKYFSQRANSTTTKTQN